MSVDLQISDLEERFSDSHNWDKDDKKEFEDERRELLRSLKNDERQHTPRILAML